VGRSAAALDPEATRRRVSAMPKSKSQITDCRQHTLSVYSGQIFCGTLTEGADGFRAFDPDGRRVGGVYPTIVRPSRELPDVTEPRS
jgi:hypothetical protein